MPEFLLIAIAVPFALGAALVLFSLFRGHRPQPFDCPRCGFDLAGAAPANTHDHPPSHPAPRLRCTECGRDVVLKPIRRFRPGPGFSLGVLLIVIGLAAAAARAAWRTLPPAQQVLYVPTVLLTHVAADRTAFAVEARDELLRRIRLGHLDRWSGRRVGQLALRVQADPSIEWADAWSQILWYARADGHISDADWAAMFDRSITASLTTRDPTRVGTETTIVLTLQSARLPTEPGVDTLTSWDVLVESQLAEPAGPPPVPPGDVAEPRSIDQPWGQIEVTSISQSMSSTGVVAARFAPIRPGKHHVAFRHRLRVFEPGAVPSLKDTHAALMSAVAPPGLIVERVFDTRTTAHAVAAGQRLAAEARRRPGVPDPSVIVTRCSILPDAGLHVAVDLELHTRYPLAFEARVRGRNPEGVSTELRLGRIVIPNRNPDRQISHRQSFGPLRFASRRAFDFGDPVDIVLVPSREIAETASEMSEYLPEEIVIPAVRVFRPQPIPAEPLSSP